MKNLFIAPFKIQRVFFRERSKADVGEGVEGVEHEVRIRIYLVTLLYAFFTSSGTSSFDTILDVTLGALNILAMFV